MSNGPENVKPLGIQGPNTVAVNWHNYYEAILGTWNNAGPTFKLEWFKNGGPVPTPSMSFNLLSSQMFPDEYIWCRETRYNNDESVSASVESNRILVNRESPWEKDSIVFIQGPNTPGLNRYVVTPGIWNGAPAILTYRWFVRHPGTDFSTPLPELDNKLTVEIEVNFEDNICCLETVTSPDGAIANVRSPWIYILPEGMTRS